MNCRYELRFTSLCPKCDCVDIYDAVFESEAMIEVESILAEVKRYEAVKIFQEPLTQALSAELGCKVTTVGFHSGVKLTAIMEP